MTQPRSFAMSQWDVFSSQPLAGNSVAVFADGRTLAHLKQDDAAKARFEEFVKMQPEDNPERKRALRYIDEPFWRAPEWLQHSPSRPPTASGFRWTISPERSC